MTRESVMDAALAVADRDGFEGITIRAIAADVGATPMALYTYFADKDALCEALRDRVFAHVTGSSSPQRTWQTMLSGMARGIHRVMREHPHWTPLMAHTSGLPPSGVDFIDALMKLMLEAGFALEVAMRSYGSVMIFAVGSVTFERLMTGDGDVIAKRLTQARGLPRKYASIASVAAKVDNFRWDDVFELGIRSLLAGIEVECVRSRPSRRK